MPQRLVPRAEALAWAGGFLLVALLIVVTRFTSGDPDSALYAGLSARLAEEPVARWIAPEWWGFWPEAMMTGLFREHPAGILFLPAALSRAGIPAEQGAYVVGAAAGLASILMIAALVSRLTSREHGRAALVLLQLMPVAFIFRIRANHEYPMLACLLLAILGLECIRRDRIVRAIALTAIGVTAGLMIKGVFVVLILAGAGVWIAVNPFGGSGIRLRQARVGAAALALMVLAAFIYDVLYRTATGVTFWQPYWERQLGPLTIVTPVEGASALAGHILFYVSRLLWHPAPWSFALVIAAWRARHSATRVVDRLTAMASSPAGRGLLFVLGFATLSVLILSPSSRFAERYAFSATYAVAAAGTVVAGLVWPRLAATLRRLDAGIPALPALVWTVLMVLRLVAGPVLPRL